MRVDIINKLDQELKEKCASSNNFFGEGIYYHVRTIVKNATLLARKYGGDEEVASIAAWLHDYAVNSNYKYYEEHYIHSANMAGELLKSMEYPTQKIELVQRCILNHRGSIVETKTTIEERCVADAISHFDSCAIIVIPCIC